jgi:excisionase family DNA binding protein
MGGGVPVAGIAETHPSFSRDDLLTATEVAEVLRVKRTTALDYMRRGIVPACKIGRRWYSAKPLLEQHLDHLFDPASRR